MSNTLSNTRRKSLQRQLDALVQEYESLNDAITNEVNPVNRTRLQRALEAKGAEMAKVESDLDALGPAPVALPAHQPTTTIGAPLVTDRIALRKALIEHFNIGELKLICDDLGVDYENLGGDSKSGKALELVQYLERRGRLEELATKIRKERPNAGI